MATTIFLVNPFVSATPPPTYLLDTYSAVAGYSLRQLKTGVTSVVRVRRSSDNSEQDFTTDEITDGTLTTWTGANDGFVVTWYDQSGSNNITQSTAANQPRLVVAGALETLSSLPTLNYLTDDYLSLGSGLSAISAEPLSIFTVYSSDVSTGFSSILSNNSTGATSNSRVQVYANTNVGQMFGVKNTSGTAYTISTGAATSSDSIGSYFIDSSKNMECFLNGSTQGTDTFTGTYVNNDLEIGKNNGNGQQIDGQISELIIFGSDESGNRTAIETDINTHYSIY
jgi:hypothetical protein